MLGGGSGNGAGPELAAMVRTFAPLRLLGELLRLRGSILVR